MNADTPKIPKDTPKKSPIVRPFDPDPNPLPIDKDIDKPNFDRELESESEEVDPVGNRPK